MVSLRYFIREIHRRSMWQVLGIYLVASWAVLQAVDTMGGALNLPDWFPSLALALLAVGLPLVLAVAYVREDSDATAVDEAESESGPETAPARSIAVLPFDDLSPGRDQQYFVEGLSEEIINALAQIDDLKVSARTSTFILAAQKSDIATLARRLGVANVLEGSVRKSGDRVRITAQLIEAERSFHLWSDTFDRELSDIFEVQDEIARAIANRLKVTLGGRGADVALVAQSTLDREAHEAYLRGRHYWGQRSPEGLRSAVTEFERAIELDPGYAEAYSGLADTYSVWELHSGFSPGLDFRDLARRAMAAARRATDLAPRLGMARTSLARAHMKCGEWDVAGPEFEAALRLSPGYATLQFWYGLYCWYTGRPEQGIAPFETAARLDPVHHTIASVHGLALLIVGRREDGLVELQRAVDLEPQWATGWRWLALGRLYSGKYEGALACFRRAHELSGAVHEFPEDAFREALDAVARYRETGEPALSEAVAGLTGGPRTSVFFRALMGDREAALRSFEDVVRSGMYEQAASHHVWFLGGLLGDDPRYRALLAEANITW